LKRLGHSCGVRNFGIFDNLCFHLGFARRSAFAHVTEEFKKEFLWLIQMLAFIAVSELMNCLIKIKKAVIALPTGLNAVFDFLSILPMGRLGFYIRAEEFSNPSTPENLDTIDPFMVQTADLVPPERSGGGLC